MTFTASATPAMMCGFSEWEPTSAIQSFYLLESLESSFHFAPIVPIIFDQLPYCTYSGCEPQQPINKLTCDLSPKMWTYECDMALCHYLQIVTVSSLLWSVFCFCVQLLIDTCYSCCNPVLIIRAVERLIFLIVLLAALIFLMHN